MQVITPVEFHSVHGLIDSVISLVHVPFSARRYTKAISFRICTPMYHQLISPDVLNLGLTLSCIVTIRRWSG